MDTSLELLISSLKTSLSASIQVSADLQGAMDILREFLESSTIHGLTYISSAKVSQQYSKILSLQEPPRQCWAQW